MLTKGLRIVYKVNVGERFKDIIQKHFCHFQTKRVINLQRRWEVPEWPEQEAVNSVARRGGGWLVEKKLSNFHIWPR